ncbi:MAG TPA: family 20 glycosylhydrolase [Terracidiphilus sp.]|nr:family 20 glycosylhydrolase [Terracidiphilus sp.]
MRFQLSFCSLVLLSAASAALAQSSPAPTCADLHVIPAPRECSAVSTVRVDESGVRVLVEHDADDEFAAKDLEDALKDRGVHLAEHETALIRLVRADTSIGRTLMDHANLKFEPAMHDEGYVLVPDGKRGLAVIAETPAGIFYGAQTVKQLFRGSDKETEMLVPTVRDWPAMAHRGLSDDWSRGPLPNMDFLKRELRTLAAYKVNIFSPYFENTFAYAATPVAAFPGGAMTPDQAREMVEYAAKYHITIIPEQEAFGHLHHVLAYDMYSPLGETPHGSVLAPGDPRTLPLISEWFGELAKVFPGPYAHIGADETNELGMGRTHDEVKQQGLGKVYLDFLSQIHGVLAPYHKQLLFWGDIAENSPELVGTLPKDMIAVSWHYDAKPDFTKNLEPFLKSGLETWVAPGVNNWNRVYPDNNEAMGNIGAFVRDGQKLGAKGELNTVWNDDGEGIFDENWFGVLFGAAAGWQPGEISQDNFIASYGLAFNNDPTGKIDQAQQQLMAAHTAFKKAGLGAAEDRYFWVDPFSPEGQQVAEKLMPVATEIRLDAEQAITLLAQAREAAKQQGRTLENQEALDAMELGARRIDFIGMKFEFANDCANLYSQAQALVPDQSQWDEVSEKLYTIGSNNGRFEDIRDGYSMIGNLYREAWLRDDRPYWLANNEARYDRATQMWVSRAMAWSLVIEKWYQTHTLPAASEVGLPAEPAK